MAWQPKTPLPELYCSPIHLPNPPPCSSHGFRALKTVKACPFEWRLGGLQKREYFHKILAPKARRPGDSLKDPKRKPRRLTNSARGLRTDSYEVCVVWGPRKRATLGSTEYCHAQARVKLSSCEYRTTEGTKRSPFLETRKTLLHNVVSKR
jgi:hypothetical protein